MILENEVSSLREKLMAHVGMIEKYRLYAQSCPDQQVRDLVVRHQQALENHYQMMSSILQGAYTTAGSNVQQTQKGLI